MNSSTFLVVAIGHLFLSMIVSLAARARQVSPFLLDGIQNTDASMVLQIPGMLPPGIQVWAWNSKSPDSPHHPRGAPDLSDLRRARASLSPARALPRAKAPHRAPHRARAVAAAFTPRGAAQVPGQVRFIPETGQEQVARLCPRVRRWARRQRRCRRDCRAAAGLSRTCARVQIVHYPLALSSTCVPFTATRPTVCPPPHTITVRIGHTSLPHPYRPDAHLSRAPARPHFYNSRGAADVANAAARLLSDQPADFRANLVPACPCLHPPSHAGAATGAGAQSVPQVARPRAGDVARGRGGRG